MALAHMLKDDFEITFFCKEISNELLLELNKNDFTCIKIKEEGEFLNQLTQNIIAVLDGYHFTFQYQEQVKATGASLVCIDDLYDKKFAADLIINHAPGVKPKDYQAKPYTKFALGLDYALLRPAFLEAAKQKKHNNKAAKVLICFGGSDVKNLTQYCLDVVLTFKSVHKIIVIIGSANENYNKIYEFCKVHPIIECYHAIDEHKMLQLMQTSDIAIVPASGILMETLATGIEVISGYYVGNQKNIYEGFKAIDAFYDAGDFSEFNMAFENMIKLKRRTKDNLIDGQSGARFVKIFKDLYN